MTSLGDRCALIIASKVKGKRSASWSCSLEMMFQFLNVGRPQRPLRGRACEGAVVTVRLHSPSLSGTEFLQLAFTQKGACLASSRRPAEQPLSSQTGRQRLSLAPASPPCPAVPDARSSVRPQPHLPRAAQSSLCPSSSFGSGPLAGRTLQGH